MKSTIKKNLIILTSILIIILFSIFIIAKIGKYPKSDLITTKNLPTNNQESSTETSDWSLEKTLIIRDELERHNNQMATDRVYSNFQNGIASIDLGRYGFIEEDNDFVRFGERFFSRGIYTSYSLRFVKKKSKNEIVSDVKREEYERDIDGDGNSDEGIALRSVEQINDFDVVISENWGPYPTFQLVFEIPGKNDNILIETSLARISGEDDYEKIIEILETLELEK